MAAACADPVPLPRHGGTGPLRCGCGNRLGELDDGLWMVKAGERIIAAGYDMKLILCRSCGTMNSAHDLLRRLDRLPRIVS